MKTKSIVLIVVSLGFGCVAAVGMVQVMAKNKNTTAQTQTMPVLVAMSDLEINDELTSENVRVEQWPIAMVPEGVVSDWDGNEGRRIAGRVIKGFPIQSEMLLQPGEYSGLNIRRGYQVYAIKGTAQATFFGLLEPGHRVNVLGIVKRANTREDVVKTFLSNVRVYAVNDETDRSQTDEEETRVIKVIQLEVTQSQAEKLALVESVGSLRLVLRDDSDEFTAPDGEQSDEEAFDELLGHTPASSEPPKQDDDSDGFDAGKLVAGIFDAMKSSRNDDSFSNASHSGGGHSMTVISADGTYVYTWQNRNLPPQMTELSGGMAAPINHGFNATTPSTTISFGNGNENKDSDYADDNDSDLEDEINTPDDSAESSDDDDLDW